MTDKQTESTHPPQAWVTGDKCLVEAVIRDTDGQEFDGMLNVTIEGELVTVKLASLRPMPGK